MDDHSLAILFWGAAVLFLGWTWLPALISGLGGAQYANGGTSDPTALAPAAGENDYAFWHRQIVALGYEPVGPAWMRLTFQGPDWRNESQVRVFYSRSRQTYAFVQKQPRPLDVWWLTMFATVWQDGGMLGTSNAVDEAPAEGAYVLQGMESVDLAAVEELHLGQKARMEAAGRKPDREGSLEVLLHATEVHAGRAARFMGLKIGQVYLLANGSIHFFLSVPIAYMMGLGHWAVPMANLVLGGILMLSDHLSKRFAASRMRAQIASHS